MTSKSGMTDLQQRASPNPVRTAAVQPVHLTRLEFPADSSFKVPHEIGNPRMHQQPWRIYFEVLTFHMKLVVIAGDAFICPLTPDAQIGGAVNHAKWHRAWLGRNAGLHSPPLRSLFRIGDRLEDPSWRSRNENLRQDRIVIWIELGGCAVDDAFHK